MTEQPTTPPEPIRPMPRLGYGVHWPAIVAEIDRDEETRRRTAEPEPTPSLGEAGSSLGAEAPVVDFSKPGFGIVSIEEARSWGIEPPPAAELLSMANDLNAHGGLDETFVAGLLRQVVDDDAPSVLNAESVLGVRGELTEEEFERLRTAAIDAMADVETVPPYSWSPLDHCRAGRHVWSTTTSPLRCVECRRYLRPWWRRALDRARRWF